MARTAGRSRITMKSTSGKVLASVALLGVAASVAGLGTYGSFTSTTSASETVTAGTVKIELGPEGANNQFTTPITGLVPGDSLQRTATLNNTGNQNYGGVTLTTTIVGTASPLTTDTTNGLQLSVDTCPTAWAETKTATGFTYTCPVTPTTILAPRALIGTGVALPGLASMAPARTDHLRITASFPATAGNEFQNAASTVNFAFDATQRAGTNR